MTTFRQHLKDLSIHFLLVLVHRHSHQCLVSPDPHRCTNFIIVVVVVVVSSSSSRSSVSSSFGFVVKVMESDLEDPDLMPALTQRCESLVAYASGRSSLLLHDIAGNFHKSAGRRDDKTSLGIVVRVYVCS